MVPSWKFWCTSAASAPINFMTTNEASGRNMQLGTIAPELCEVRFTECNTLFYLLCDMNESLILRFLTVKKSDISRLYVTYFWLWEGGRVT